MNYLLGSAVAVGLAFAFPGASYEQENLLSDGFTATPNVNPNLVNAWGLAASPTGPFWIANEATGTSSIVLADGSANAPDVAVPADHSAHSTGLVFNGGGGFEVTGSTGTSGSSLFIFVTLEGRILGWNPQVDAANAIVAVDNSAGMAETYTGAALATHGGRTYLYVANLAAGTIDVYDHRFLRTDSFTDENAPSGYSPFNVAEIDGELLVAFVPLDPMTGEEIPGPGHGLIDRFLPDGTFLGRLTGGGELNAPWGMVRAPGGFGPFSNKLLVGNFGDGRILGYGNNGHFFGALEDDEGEPIVVEGLWGLMFGNGGLGGDPRDLYFTAGPEDETHGLFGEIEFDH